MVVVVLISLFGNMFVSSLIIDSEGIKEKWLFVIARKRLRWSDVEGYYFELQLQWFDTVEEVKISSELRSKRWNTEVTERDRLYLTKLGMNLA